MYPLRRPKWLRRPRLPNDPVVRAAVIGGFFVLGAALIGGFFALLVALLPAKQSSPNPPSAGAATPAVTPSTASPLPSASTTQSPHPTVLPSESSVGNGVVIPPGISIAPGLRLNSQNFCSWRFGTHPIPLAVLDPPRVRIDDRCNYPQDPDPTTDHPTGVYSTPSQESGAPIDRIPDGTEVSLMCYTQGQEISDAVGDSSVLWLGVELSNGLHGYIPDVNIGGGYSQQQLGELKLSEC
jgi:hypothetical protein